MAVKKDIREVKSKKKKDKLITKTTYKCEGNYVDFNGVAHRYHKRGFETSEDAKCWERAFILKASKEVGNDHTFGDLYNLYASSKKGKIKERSYIDLEFLYEARLSVFWKNKKLKSITLKTIENFQNEIINLTHTTKIDKETVIKQYSNSYLESIQTLLKAIIRYGIKMGYIHDIKLDNFKVEKRANYQKKVMDFWTPEEFNKFIDVVDDEMYVCLFNILYWCGLRLGEVLALTWADIDFAAKSIEVSKTYSKKTHRITTPKTKNSYRQVLMPKKCFESLEALYEDQKDYPAFNEDCNLFYFDKHLDENTIRRYKDDCICVAKVKRIRIHDFRHSHVSLLVNKGFSSFDIAKRLGHTVNMVNETYGHWFKEAQLNMIKILDEL